MQSNYTQLEAHFARMSKLSHLMAIAGWDEAAMMPPGGGEARAEGMAALGVVLHEMVTEPQVADWLAAASEEQLDDWQQANVRKMTRYYTESNCLPSELVEREQLLTARCEQAWRTLRADNDWESMQPLLEDVVGVAREKAVAMGEAKSLSPYDALLDSYEPDMRSERVAELFDGLKAFLPGLIDEVIERQAGEAAVEPQGPFPVQDQRSVAEVAMRTLGFDFDHGRLDISHHPFCGGVPDDVRITTRYVEDDFLRSLMGVIHETGHALYEQGLPAAWRHQPVGESLSTATHESQSLLMEMQACRTPEFLNFIAPVLQQQFLGGVSDDPTWSADNLRRLFTRVRRSYIRVDADELTYPMHIVLRFEMERDLISGDLEVRDLPGVWDEKMQAYLGLSTAGNFRDGVMQDVHWPAGLFGYFPTYSLGAMTAAQLFRTARADLPGLLDAIGQGDFSPLVGWLRDKVHSKGSLLGFDELLKSATGETLNVEYFKAHLRARYLEN